MQKFLIKNSLWIIRNTKNIFFFPVDSILVQMLMLVLHLSTIVIVLDSIQRIYCREWTIFRKTDKCLNSDQIFLSQTLCEIHFTSFWKFSTSNNVWRLSDFTSHKELSKWLRFVLNIVLATLASVKYICVCVSVSSLIHMIFATTISKVNKIKSEPYFPSEI